MEKVIKIGEKEVRLSNNVEWTMEYRDQFNKDIVPAIMPLLSTMTEAISSDVSEAGTDLTLQSIADAVQGRANDILLPMYQLEFVDLANVTWAMAKAADEDIDPPPKWFRQFDNFPLDVIGPAVFELVMKGFVSSKNLIRLKGLKVKLENLQPSRSTTSSSQDSNEG